ncbi:MAG: hypothetical protein ACKV2O_12720 [Acidimicrobiales bacterium]
MSLGPDSECHTAGDSRLLTRLGTRRWSAPVGFLLLSAVLAGWVWLSDRFFGHSAEHPETVFPGSGLLGGWVHFDASWYRYIAEVGYELRPGQQSNVAFFPLYPLVMRPLRGMFGSSFGAGMAITFGCGLAGVTLFQAWCRQRVSPIPSATASPGIEPIRRLGAGERGAALALLLLYPYVWYLVGAVYADALFLVTTLSAFLLLERGHPVAAGVVGALAAATRPVGPAVVIGMAVRQLERRGALRTTTRTWRNRTWALPIGVSWRMLRPADAGVLLAGVGFAAYSLYLWVRFDDPLLFSTVQKYWNQPSGPVTWLKLHLAGITLLKFADRWLYIIGCVFQGLLSVGSLLLVGRIRRRFGWGYAALVLFLMGIPVLGSKDFQGLGRYLLAAFPVFAWAGTWLVRQPRHRQRLVLAGSALTLVVWSHLYARGYYVA